MTEEMKYYTGNCITDLHTDTSISHCNEEKCKQYVKSDGLNFCMSSVCPEKDCIYALVYKLHQKIDGLEQENKRLNEKLFCYAYEKDCHLQCKQKDCAIKNYYRYKSALENILQICEETAGWYTNRKIQSLIKEALECAK